jgi:hypothetical protein
LGTAEKLKKFMKIYRKTEIFITLLFIGGVGDTPHKVPQAPPLAGELLRSSPALNMKSCDNFCFLLVKKVFWIVFQQPLILVYFFLLYLLFFIAKKI